MEPLGIEKISKFFNVVISSCGLFIHPIYNWLGASPDGIIFNKNKKSIKYTVEVKFVASKNYRDEKL